MDTPLQLRTPITWWLVTWVLKQLLKKHALLIKWLLFKPQLVRHVLLTTDAHSSTLAYSLRQLLHHSHQTVGTSLTQFTWMMLVSVPWCLKPLFKPTLAVLLQPNLTTVTPISFGSGFSSESLVLLVSESWSGVSSVLLELSILKKKSLLERLKN